MPDRCPRCEATPFEPFLRGQVSRSCLRSLWLGMTVETALICFACKEIVDWEPATPRPVHDGLLARYRAEFNAQLRTPIDF